MIKKIGILFILFHCSGFSEKVLIITSAYNRPDFIETQHRTFQKFLKDDYEFVVFNDARDKSMRSSIADTCKRLEIRCFNIPQSIHDMPYLHREPREDFHAPAVRNSNVVQYALNNLGFDHEGIVFIIDSDMFLVREFSIEEFLKGYQIAGVPQSREKAGVNIPYLWIGIAFLDMKNLPDKRSINFNCGGIHGIPVDAGGYTYYYLKNHPEVSVKYFSSVHSPTFSCKDCLRIHEYPPCTHNTEKLQEYGLDYKQIRALHSGLQNVEFLIHGAFFHYRSGTNWDHKTAEFHERKTRVFNTYISDILQ